MLGASICGALLLTGSPEPAADDITLSWDAPAQCPAKDEVIARVRARWGERPSVRIEAEAVVERSVRDPEAWHLRLWVRGDEVVAEREIEAQTCDALADAAATMLAVAATTPASPGTEIPAPAVVAPAKAVPTAIAPSVESITPVDAPTRSTSVPASAAPTKRIAKPRARLGALGGLDYGALPGLGGTIVVEVGLHWPRMRVSAFGMYGFGRRVAARDVAARHQLAAGGLSICGVAPLRAFELGGCAGGELGALLSEGVRGRALTKSRTIWGAGSIGAFAAWRFASRWSLVLRVDAVLPTVRREFLVGDARVGRVGRVGVRALGGLAVVLP